MEKNKHGEDYAINNKGQKIIETDKRYFRPTEVHNLVGNSSKAKKHLKWSPKIKIKALVKEMISEEILKL